MKENVARKLFDQNPCFAKRLIAYHVEQREGLCWHSVPWELYLFHFSTSRYPREIQNGQFFNNSSAFLLAFVTRFSLQAACSKNVSRYSLPAQGCFTFRVILSSCSFWSEISALISTAMFLRLDTMQSMACRLSSISFSRSSPWILSSHQVIC